ncbi:MAG: DUF11 domain-containing protein [Proteobacteria bacterium]|nr:DUF11 domain-containing protein [Pseudomonadota bacterium]
MRSVAATVRKVRGGLGYWAVAAVALASLGAPGTAAAQSADVSVAAYTWTPDPVPNGAAVQFTVRTTNNGPSAANGAVLTVNLAPSFQVANQPGLAFPASCSLSGAVGAQVLACPITPFPSAASVDTVYTASAITAPSSAGTSASIAPPVGTTDPNTLNNNTSRNPTVRLGVDLAITKTPSATTLPGGATLTYTLATSNAGPDLSNAVQVTDFLPPQTDLNNVTASGTSWGCTVNAGVPNVVCVYFGAAIGVGNYPPITISGRINRGITGTITNSAQIGSSNSLILDRDASNDVTPNVVVTVTPGADLRAQVSMASNPATTNIAVTIPLTLSNLGPATVSGATIAGTIPAGFVLGTMPAGCTPTGSVGVGWTVTCVSGTIASGNNQVFVLPATTPSVATSGNLTALVTPPSGITDPIPGNDNATTPFTVVEPFADLSVTKTKGPNPVSQGATITSTIVVRNNGVSASTYTPLTPLRITDAFGANEIFTGVLTAGWTCPAGPIPGPATVTCETTGSGSIANGATTSVQLTSQATGIGGAPPFPTITNQACTGSTANSLATPLDPTGDSNDCTGNIGIVATTRTVDLSIDKTVGSTTGGPFVESLTIPTAQSNYVWRLVVTNNGPDTAPTVRVANTLGEYIGAAPFTSGVTLTAPAGDSCTRSGASVTCTLTNLAPAESRTILIEMARSVESGTFNNQAFVSSPDAVDSNSGNNSDPAQVTIDPIADVTVTQKTVNPNPVVVGVPFTYTISFSNVGPTPASSVVVSDPIDPTRFTVTAGSVSTTRSGVTCTFVANVASCPMGTMTRGQTFQMSFQAIPRYPFPGTPPNPGTHTNTATITTVTDQGVNAAVDSRSATHDVIVPDLDLLVTKQEPVGGDPLPYGDPLAYQVTIQNDGPSRATNVELIDIPAAPPPGYTMTPTTVVLGTTNTTAPRAPVCTIDAPVVGQIRCVASPTAANNYLDPGEIIRFDVTFTVAGPAPSGSLTFVNGAQVRSDESIGGYDRLPLNNTVSENTTVLPSTDLEAISKTLVTASPVNVNQPTEFTVVIRNNGPSPTNQARIVDVLPPGFQLVGSVTAPAGEWGGSATVTGLNCTGTTTVTCALDGSLLPGPTNTITLHYIARPVYPYTGAIGSNVTNTATISPGLDGSGNPVSRDTVPGNNSQSAVVQVQRASLAGNVYADNNRDDTFGAGEAIGSVTLTLTGTDIYGNAIGAGPAVTVQTNGAGTYLFDNLPPGDYVITETQPGAFVDSAEFVGTGAGGTASPNCPPAANCGNTATQNRISGLTLPANTQATNYNFQEYALAQMSGFVYVDANDNGNREGGETGINGTSNPVQIRLSGTDYAGNAISLTQNTNASGAYAFNNLPPSDATGYVVTQVNEPTGFADGADQNGAGVGNVIANSRGRPVGETIPGTGAIVVNPAANLTERNFGELAGAQLSGRVYIDPNANAVREGTENAGVAGVAITLTGTTDTAQAVNCTTTTSATGTYAFPVTGDPNPLCATLRPGSYTLTQTTIPGLTTTGTFNGTLGGNGQGANTPSVGTNVSAAIPVTAGANGQNYDFGVQGQGLSGSVYVDTNGNGTRDTGERGIPGVTVTVSGNAANGVNVCTVISPNPCTAITDANGNYGFPSLPGSDGTGYTLTEQPQTNAPLTQYGDGAESVGQINGTATGSAATNDVISAIVLPTGAAAMNYNFGERPASLAGVSYVDLNNDGVADAGEDRLPNVTLTLSGTTLGGADVCTVITTCVVTTDANGAYLFNDLPAGTYTVTQTQPASYADGTDTPGNFGGAPTGTAGAAGTSVISNIIVPAGGTGVAFNFAETPSFLVGRAFFDPDNNGVQDTGEPNLTNTVVTVQASDGRTLTVTTDGNGDYRIPVPAGPTQADVTDPAGTELTTANDPQTVNVPLGGTGTATPVGFRYLGPDATVVKTATPAIFTEANRGTFSIVVSNVALALDTTGVYTVVDTLPAGMTVAEIPTGTGWNCATTVVGSQTATCTSSVVLASNGGTAAPITLNVNVAAGAAANSPLVNTVRVDGGGEPNGLQGNNESTLSVPLQQGGQISGSVWFDIGQTGRQRDAGDTPLPGWVVDLVDPNAPAGTAPVRTTQTDAAGNYSFLAVIPGTYNVLFRDPTSGVGYGVPVNGNTGNPQAGSQLAPGNPRGALEVVLPPGGNIPQQSLPVDPSGVVYDAVTREVVSGATVTLQPVGSCPTYDPATMIVNAGAGGYTISGSAISMTTGSNGYYQFLLGANAPASCTFELVTTPPALYTAPSTLIPTSGSFTAQNGAGVVAIQPQATAPPVGASTTYYTQIVFGSATLGLVHNHIPLDPVVPSIISLEKTVDDDEVELGDSVRYTIVVRNVQGGGLPDLTITDRLPLGFRYIEGTSRILLPGSAGAVEFADPEGAPGPILTFPIMSPLPANQAMTLTYRVRVGVGAQQGDGINRARAVSDAVSSNEGRAKVKVLGGVFTTEACVIGKIYADCNENDVQDHEEVGVPGVRLYFEDGTYLISDSEGKYSYCGLKPITHVLKVDRSTLPKGALLDTVDTRNAGDADSRFVDLRNGELHRADFHVRNCSSDVMGQVFGRRASLGEVAAPEVEKGDDVPALTLDSRKDTRCELTRQSADGVYRESNTSCRPAPKTSRKRGGSR